MQARVLLLALLMMAVVPLMARAEQFSAPPEISRYIKAQQPYGTATLNKLGLRIYDASLWTDRPSWSMTKTYALTLVYGMDISADDLLSRSLDEMAREEPLSQEQRSAYARKLADVLPDVAKGDRITALYRPGKGLFLYHNGHLRGRLPDKSFAMRFMGIWLAEGTSEPALRRELLRLPAEPRKSFIRLE